MTFLGLVVSFGNLVYPISRCSNDSRYHDNHTRDRKAKNPLSHLEPRNEIKPDRCLHLSVCNFRDIIPYASNTSESKCISQER